MKNLIKLIPVLLVLFIFYRPIKGEIIEQIYAVVNDEVITLSELKKIEYSYTMDLNRNFQGEELQNKLQEMRAGLLKNIIDDKLLFSKAKEKNYDVSADVELILKEIKKQNNWETDEELKNALESQGITLEQFKEFQKTNRMKQRLIYEEIGSKIKVDNSEIMEYYKKNPAEFTDPAKFSLNCIYLNRENYTNDRLLEEKKNEISTELKGTPFAQVGSKYSELPNPENKIFLGEFKKGELHKNIEEAAINLKKDEFSDWIDTENGFYIIQLIDKTESRLKEYKDVRDEIGNKLTLRKQDVEIEKFLEVLRQNSYVRIYKEYR